MIQHFQEIAKSRFFAEFIVSLTKDLGMTFGHSLLASRIILP
jgi:hypothetical protein